MNFEGSVAVVTGAAHGLGLATAKLLAARGARVCLADLDDTGAKAAADTILERGGRAFSHRVDVTDPEANRSMVDAVVAEYGRLDLAFLNAGVATQQALRIGEMPIEDWDRIMNVDLRGVFLGLSACAGPISMSDVGSIVLTSSLSGLRATPGTAAYMSAKHAVIGLAKSAAIDLAPAGVRVNAICPGMVPTEIFAGFGADIETRSQMLNATFGDVIPMGRVGSADEIAKLVAFLLSDESSYVTGSAYEIDGGLSITTAMSGKVQSARW